MVISRELLLETVSNDHFSLESYVGKHKLLSNIHV